MSKKSRTFVLRDINTDEVDKKYDIKLVSNIGSINDFIPKNSTKISELTDKSSVDIVSFLDESKRLHKCFVTMINFNDNEEMKYYAKYNCYWDRHPIDTKAIGCPIRYVSKVARKVYNSEISKETYSIRENVTKHKSNIIDKSKIDVSDKDYFETDGSFCSFNCVMAFILDNKHNRLYDLSSMLITKMYNDIMDNKNSDLVVIKPAPSWRLLLEYGGNLTIKEFRQSFNKIDFESHGYIKNFPEFVPIGQLHEQKIKF